MGERSGRGVGGVREEWQRSDVWVRGEEREEWKRVNKE